MLYKCSFFFVRGACEGGYMTDRQDRLHELCVQVKTEENLVRLRSAMAEINDILGSLLSEVEEAVGKLRSTPDFETVAPN
jgi:hypothetical protein